MKKNFTGIICLFFILKGNSQELFVLTEPASNMPAKSIGLRLTNNWMNNPKTNKLNYFLLPEIMWGVNKKLMLHAEFIATDRYGSLKYGGLSFYGKYRFYSEDGIHNHFRLAAYTRASTNNGTIHQEEIEINGNNSGYELGLVATKLVHKVAVSASTSYEKAGNNTNNNKFPTAFSDQAINYTLSIGKLMLPKNYNNYQQTNVNFMVEMLGQSIVNRNKRFVDIAPSIQFIFNSQTRLDIGYRKQLYSNMVRMSNYSYLVRLEHLIFN
ncbi:MAG: hypothetical protein ACOVNY_06595 [Chitinophagaceae bacterium]